MKLTVPPEPGSATLVIRFSKSHESLVVPPASVLLIMLPSLSYVKLALEVNSFEELSV
ncbi:MAG TPA: hypothetical protein VN044_06020 [Verrucomicrobiae bacterium]|nr:hypothetical protein [Verrucomicrobiae bacterium]